MNKEVERELEEILTYYNLKDKKDINWLNISVNQKLSKNFIREFKDKLYLEYLLSFNKISKKFYNELIK